MAVRATVKKDDLFYFRSVVFEIEDTLFNIPRYGLTIDHAFDALFSPIEADELAGSSDEHPIHLENATAEQFRSLLKVLFPPPGREFSSLDLRLDEWTSVLVLATQWRLDSVRDLAISLADEHVAALDLVGKIILGKRFKVARWLREAYCALAMREWAPSIEERNKLGWQTYGQLMDVREQSWVWGSAQSLTCGELIEDARSPSPTPSYSPTVRTYASRMAGSIKKKAKYKSQKTITKAPGSLQQNTVASTVTVTTVCAHSPAESHRIDFDFEGAVRRVFGEEVEG